MKNKSHKTFRESNKFVTVDTKADAVYLELIRFKKYKNNFFIPLKQKVLKTKTIYNKEVLINLDFDKKKRLVGIEIV